jgi:hypothetical protein
MRCNWIILIWHISQPRTIRVDRLDDGIAVIGTQLSNWYTDGPGEFSDVTTMPLLAFFGEIGCVLVHDIIL